MDKITGWNAEQSRMVTDEESANYPVCVEAAKRAGYTESHVIDFCDGGDLNCPTCPWKATEVKDA